MFGVQWVIQRWVIDLLNSLGGQVGCCTIKKVWRLALLCLMWCLWHERNARNFEDIVTSVTELLKIVFNTLYIG
jgi:hypothetical protein